MSSPHCWQSLEALQSDAVMDLLQRSNIEINRGEFSALTELLHNFDSHTQTDLSHISRNPIEVVKVAMFSKPIPHLSAHPVAPVPAGPSSSVLTTSRHPERSLLSVSVVWPYSPDTTASSNPVTAPHLLPPLPIATASFLQHNSQFDSHPHPPLLLPRPNSNLSVGKIIHDMVPDEFRLDTAKPPTYLSLPEPAPTIVAADLGALFPGYLCSPFDDQTLLGTMETVSPPCGSRSYSFPGSLRELSLDSGRASGNPPAGISRCSSCKVMSSPAWKMGPSGRKDLCNACVFHISRLSRPQDLTR